MSVSATTTIDIAADMATALETIPDLRVYQYVADNFRPPGVVIAQPSIDFADPSAGFCAASWSFPLHVVVSRNRDKEAQTRLSDYVMQIANVLDDMRSAYSVEPQDARPIDVNVNGTELPGYQLMIRVRG